MIMDLSELLRQFLTAELHIGESTILWREIVGNGFGLASAILGMQRRVAAWPIGIVGNILLFTVFLGGVFDTPSDLNLYGQAGRQVFFLDRQRLRLGSLAAVQERPRRRRRRRTPQAGPGPAGGCSCWSVPSC